MFMSEIDGFKRRARLFLVLLLGACTPLEAALDLTATQWEASARRHGIDPLLLYALALRETSRPSGPGAVSPWPWTLRSPQGRRFYDSREAARSALAALAKQTRDVGVGLVQVSLKRHGHRVGDPASLLDARINLAVAAGALAEAIDAARGDLALGVGRYRYPDDDGAARTYGRRVLT